MTTPSPSAERLWLATLDELLAGMHHALNNRLMTIQALSRLIQETPDDARLSRALASEVAQLDELRQLLRLLPRSPEPEPQGIHLPDVLDEVLALQQGFGARDGAAHRRDEATDVSPVWADGAALARALFVLLAPGAEPGTAQGARACDIRLEGGTHGCVCLVITPRAEEEGSGDVSRGDARLPLSAVRALVEAAGAELEATGESAGKRSYTLRFLALDEAKRRGP